MRDKCGVFAAKSDTDVFDSIYYALHAMQHRGQESAGIATCNDRIRVHKDMGLVTDVFKKSYLSGNKGIGHVRYSTKGESKIENSQPLVVNYLKGSFAIAHNGQIVNHREIMERLEALGNTFITTSDTEIIAKLIAYEHVRSGDFIQAIKSTMSQLIGSYSLTLLYGQKIYGVRDPGGVKPLCIGKKDNSYYMASESCAFDVLGAKLVRDVKPSEIVEIGESIRSHMGPKTRQCQCMFEFVYFSRADSVIDGKSVYQVRRQLGANLAREFPVEADMVCPVPDSGITHSLGYAMQSGIPASECLMKNRYVGRTFIMPAQSQRDIGVRVKLNPIRSEIKGKRIILVDDSIVRGTTLRRIIYSLKEAGAREVHVRIACPPILHPCLYGVDMQTNTEFIANGRCADEIAEIIGADSLRYQSIEGLLDALGLEKGQLCLACITGEYPLEDKQTKLTDD
jgi:amidophosphoribosyltransferase